jgi:hypothetical protein
VSTFEVKQAQVSYIYYMLAFKFNARYRNAETAPIRILFVVPLTHLYLSYLWSVIFFTQTVVVPKLKSNVMPKDS